jgi:hypothetical protein
MGKTETVSAKIPAEVYKEFTLRVPRGERSNFIRDAINEKLEEIPRPDRLSELELRITNLEAELPKIRKYLVRLEAMTYEQGTINPHVFGIDEIDRQIIDHLIHYKGATTPELAEETHTNRWLILNRLRRIQKRSKAQLGKPIIEYYSGIKMGKKKAWWLNHELVES